MKTTKISLVNIQEKLSRTEMKKIMAGSGSEVNCQYCVSDSECATGHVCRSSISCFYGNVCAKPYYAEQQL